MVKFLPPQLYEDQVDNPQLLVTIILFFACMDLVVEITHIREICSIWASAPGLFHLT